MGKEGGMSDTDLIKRSITRSDYEQGGMGSGVLQVLIAPTTGIAASPGLPPWWSRERDIALSQTIDFENMWSSAVYKAITKKAARGWQVQDSTDSKRRTQQAQDLLHSADGAGWVSFLFRHLQD